MFKFILALIYGVMIGFVYQHNPDWAIGILAFSITYTKYGVDDLLIKAESERKE